MRISDWSSDVCSSDLVGQPHLLARIGENVDQRIISLDLAVRNPAAEMDLRRGGRSRRLRLERGLHRNAADEQQPSHRLRGDARGHRREQGDRDSVVEGKSVAGRVNPGGRLISKKKKNQIITLT